MMMIHRHHVLSMLFCLTLAILPAVADDSSIDPSATISDQVLEGVVTGIRGMVQIRQSEDEPWVKAQNGMKLSQGAEFRTGPRSSVQFRIPPDQIITLDRLGTVKLINAIAQNNKIKTDLGMSYGRTRYDIRKAGFEHESTIRSPSATLAVRGTRVGIQDGAMGFYAWSTQSRAQLYNKLSRQNLTFGEDTHVDSQGGAADNMQRQGTVYAGDDRSRDGDETFLDNTRPGDAANLYGSGGNNLTGNRAVSTNFEFGDNQANQFTGDLRFELFWDTYYGGDLTLTVLDPENYNSAVTPGPGNVPFPNATTELGDNFAADMTIGDAVNDYGGAGVTEVVNFTGTYPQAHVIGITNVYNGDYLSQNYTINIYQRDNSSEDFTQIGTFYDDVDDYKTNLHTVVITNGNEVSVSETVGVIDNISNLVTSN
ncbi:MAG TPA: hypothetical protein DCM28_18555 [Phycisphaerales bacterium]|nr:hypothetical protein [Phycisphaerales bacterium]HCD33170.1 hypothetical protein [Phycisphaerales bacterium]|tara:strand:+ start:820 stop:2094 length:1275 start_codon:yes stop_codon:yes gene_type:complete